MDRLRAAALAWWGRPAEDWAPSVVAHGDEFHHHTVHLVRYLERMAIGEPPSTA